jgi:hypothetical protein
MDRDDRQMIVLNRRLGGHIEPGPKAYDFRGWLAVATDPAGGKLLSAVVLHRRAGAAAIPLLRRSGCLFRW